MFSKIASAVSSVVGSRAPTPPGDTSRTGTPMSDGAQSIVPSQHYTAAREKEYAQLAQQLNDYQVPVSLADCAACDIPCDDKPNGGAGTIVEAGNAWDGKTYGEYVEDKYGELGGLPRAIDTDWDSDLAGSGTAPVGRIVVVSTGKSDWPRDHYDDKTTLSHHLEKVFSKAGPGKKMKGDATNPSTYVLDSAFPPPAKPFEVPVKGAPSLYSSSMLTQADDPEDQTTIVFPDWKVVNEVENTPEGAQTLWNNVISGDLGRAGKTLQNKGEGINRMRSTVLPYRAIVLLCSHKRRDKRCSIAAPLLRQALVTCLEKNGVQVDETGAALATPEETFLEDFPGTSEEREAEVGRRISEIEGVKGGEGGQVGIFNINHLGGHRYSGVMLILFPSGAYLSYGRVSPQEIPRVVEETLLQGKVVPGLLRAATGVRRPPGCKNGFLEW